MSIEDVQKLAAILAQQITDQVQAFEKATACSVHSLPVHGERKPTTVQVKVQIP